MKHKNAFYKDIFRTLKNNLSRFIAIAVMVTLGIGVFAGFAVGCLDVLRSADIFYHKQNNYDIQIVSTLGLTGDDLTAISDVDGVNAVFGNVSMDTKAGLPGDILALVNLTTLDVNGMNTPYVTEGVLPIKAGQIAVNTKFIADTGLNIGDRITLTQGDIEKDVEEDVAAEDSKAEEDTEYETHLEVNIESDSGEPELVVNEYEITAVVEDPLDITNTVAGMASVSFSGNSKYTMYVTSDCIESDIYTAIYVTVDGARELDSYSDEYTQLIKTTTSEMKEAIQEERQQARYDEIVKDANIQISEGEELLAEKMDDAEQKMEEAQREIDDGFISLEDGKAEVHISETDLLSGEKTMADAKKSADERFTIAQKEIDDGLAQLEALEAELNSQEETILNSPLEEMQKAASLEQLAVARAQLESGKENLMNGQKELDDNKAELAEKQREIEDGKIKIAEAKEELAEAEIELEDGQKELDENRKKYQESIAEAKNKLADAKVEVSDIAMAKWYVWDRSDNESFASLKSDMNFIQAVTKAFPIIFFLVAVLICLTSMTRMVEEDRGLIGTYKSLGYSNFRISLKYIIYAVLACIIGGILGSIIGFIGLPMVIKSIFSNMYIFPLFELHFFPSYAFGGFGLFLLGIVGATALSCATMLRQLPAHLMRPKAPKAGSRILLERIPFIWKRMNFLRKITCRNLFRYKKRAAMTIIGILGCTMLIVLGFGLRDTVDGLMSDQFDTVTVYDSIIVTDDLKKDEMNALSKEWIENGKVKDAIQLQLLAMTLSSESDHVEITVMIIPDDADLDSYIHLQDSEMQETMSLPLDGIAVTENAAKVLNLASGDTASLLNEDKVQFDFAVSFVATNYAGNYVYVSKSAYQKTFGDYSGTAFLVHLADKIEGEKWLDSLSEDERILSVSSSQSIIDSFNEINIDIVLFILIGMSAVLALAVLFTLSNINISERIRELATIKVLGFQREEVYSYVNKETVILSLIGILCGLPAGYAITYGIMANISMAGVAFKVRVSFSAYLISAALTLVFTLLVNKITNKGLRKINMVEALKSVE